MHDTDGAPEPTSGLAYSFRAFRHRGFTLFWWAAIVSQTGSWMANITVPVVVFMLTESAMWVGIAAAAQFIPNALIGPWAGALTDRFQRKWVLVYVQVAMGLSAFAIWAVWVAGIREVWALLIPIALQGALNGINMPAWQSFVNDLVPQADLRSAIAFNSVQFNLGRAIGPAIAGVLIAVYDPAIAFLVNAISFLAVPAVLLLITPLNAQPKVRGVRPIHDFVSAIGLILRTPSLRLAVIIAVAIGFFGNPLFNLTVVFGSEVYDVGPVGISLLGTALGVGAILAVPFVSGWSAGMSLERTARVGLWLYVVTLLVLSIVPTYETGIIALMASGAAFSAVNASANTALQMNAPDHVRGRVVSARIVLFTGAMPLGALVQTAIADSVGVQWSTAFAAAGFLLLYLFTEFPRRRRAFSWLDHTPKLSPTGA